jgi:hypothetical protein
MHSDEFSKSIPDIVLMSNFKNMGEFASRLDENGYYGRYNIKLAMGNKKHTYDNYIVNVYLPDSVFSYTWPYKSAFNITEKRILKSKQAKFYKAAFTRLVWYLQDLPEPIEELNLGISYDIAVATTINFDIIQPMLVGMFQDGLIKDGKTIIKSGIDAVEIYENQYSYKNKMLLG